MIVKVPEAQQIPRFSKIWPQRQQHYLHICQKCKYSPRLFTCVKILGQNFRTPWQKLSKESKALNAIHDELDLIDIYRTLPPEPKNTHSILMLMEHSQE